ncbi:MAG TPA: YncE family protein [Solirubrobacteraceae bacterium]|nr:YncE family protein [Solirubrobacteraceae bacterium]
MRRSILALTALGVSAVIAGCGGSSSHGTTHRSSAPAAGAAARHTRTGPLNIYAADTPGNFSPVVRHDPALVYVPNSDSNTVDVISQKTFKVIDQFVTGAIPQHVTPAWNLKTLWVDNNAGNTLTPINPRTAKPGKSIPVEDPYNLYFTPNGKYAIVVAERLRQLQFRNPNTMALIHTLTIPPCDGLDHADFSVNGRYMYASCEFAGRMVEVDTKTMRLMRVLVINKGASAPQDVKLSPNGRTLYTADQDNAGVWMINPSTFKVTGFIHTAAGAHGLYPSRNFKYMYVSDREAGAVSVVSFATNKVIKTWQLPLPASPDMGGVSADGKTLWLSGRYNSVVYAINTITGKLRAEIPVGPGPHGLCVWPQPGNYSIGHTGIMR